MAARDFDLAVDDMDDLPDTERLEVLEDVFAEPLPDEPPHESDGGSPAADAVEENSDPVDVAVRDDEPMNFTPQQTIPQETDDPAGELAGEETSEPIDDEARDDVDALEVLEATVAQLDDGEVRDPQRRMCELVAKALAEGTHLAVQAGTGVGKSFAYGVPAALHDKRVVIATATKALQDQLKSSDMPMVAQAVRSTTGRAPVIAVLKGRNNYVCLHRLGTAQAELQGELLADGDNRQELREQLVKVVDFATHSPTGDLAELDFQPGRSTMERISITSAECPGKSNCASGERCFTERARDRAAEADVVVVNHALYVSHLAMQRKVLPEHEAVIIDEAHQFADWVTSTAGLTVGRARFDRVVAGATGLGDRELISSVEEVASALEAALNDDERDLQVEQQELRSGETPLASALVIADGRLTALSEDISDDIKMQDDPAEHQALVGLIADLLGDLRAIQDEVHRSGDQNLTFFIDGPDGRRELRGVPIDVSDYVRRQLRDEDSTTVVFASATLDSQMPADLGFGNRRQENDMSQEPEDQAINHECRYEDVGSPFDYQKNALLYVPKHMPAPNQAGYREDAQAEIEALIGAIGGRTLALFTSWRALNETYEALGEKKVDLGINLHRQGDELSNPALIDLLRTDPAAVICGTMTFWQGVDVPGDGLQLLIMDKLPFPVPTEPLFAARAKHLESDGGRNSFSEMSIPHASRLLAQGLGRLIRTSTDRGVAVVLDSRLATKNYRHRLLKPVPPMRRTIDLADALTFLRSLRSS